MTTATAPGAARWAGSSAAHSARTIDARGVDDLARDGPEETRQDWTSIGGPDRLLFAKTVNGQPLTSTAAIEAAAGNGNLALINLGPGAVIIGAVTGN